MIYEECGYLEDFMDQKPRRIIGIDPGQTTGFVDLLEHDGVLHVLEALEIRWEERFLFKQLLGIMNYVPNDLLPEAIIMEAFILRANAAHHQVGNQFPSVRIIGIVEAFAYDLGIRDRIHLQPPALKEFVKIKNELPRSAHIKDAYRHARYFVVRERNRK